jgi:hypothetical protein
MTAATMAADLGVVPATADQAAMALPVTAVLVDTPIPLPPLPPLESPRRASLFRSSVKSAGRSGKKNMSLRPGVDPY